MVGLLIIVVLIVGAVKLLQVVLLSPGRIGKRGEKIVSQRIIDGLSGVNLHLTDVYLPLPDGTTTQIDHIVVNRYGIFVVEIKNYSGWIFGDEQSVKWTQAIYKSKHTFQNPIRQNYRHICALSDCLGIPRNLFVSVVAFTGDCTFKTDMPNGVVYSRQATSYISSFRTQLIKDIDVPEVFHAIKKWNESVGEEKRAAHVRNLSRRHAPVSSMSDAPKCPYCGAPMARRVRKSDGKPFYGCSKYPACRGIVNIRL